MFLASSNSPTTTLTHRVLKIFSSNLVSFQSFPLTCGASAQLKRKIFLPLSVPQADRVRDRAPYNRMDDAITGYKIWNAFLTWKHRHLVHTVKSGYIDSSMTMQNCHCKWHPGTLAKILDFILALQERWGLCVLRSPILLMELHADCTGFMTVL